MNIRSLRFAFFLGFLFTLWMIVTALVLQYFMHLEPCPLCIAQRVVVIALSIVFLIALIHNPKTWGIRLYGLIITSLTLLGYVVAGRHTWLQHLPEDQIPECGPGLDYWMNHLPANVVVQKVFQGTGDCAIVVFNFLGLSIPEWSLIAFIPFLLFGLKILITGRLWGEG